MLTACILLLINENVVKSTQNGQGQMDSYFFLSGVKPLKIPTEYLHSPLAKDFQWQQNPITAYCNAMWIKTIHTGAKMFCSMS